jgi:hypothetical protein
MLCICHRVLFSDGAVHISDDSLIREWTKKSIRQWGSHDVLCWIISVANDRNLESENINVAHFQAIDGTTLYTMSEAEFVSKESQYGNFLYGNLQRLKQEQDEMAYDSNKREFFFCKYTLCEGSLHVACSVQNGKRVWLQWYAVMLMLLDKFNFCHQFSL